MANRFSFADTSGFQGYYNQLQARAAREEQERQRKKLEEQRRKASNHAGFGQALSTVASLGGAALGAGLTGGSMTGAMAGYSLGNAAAGGLMSLFPNIGGTEPSGDNPYYDKPSDLARFNSVVGAGLQGYGMIQQQMKQDAAQNFAGFTNTFIRNNPGSTEEEIYTALKGKDSPYEEAKGLFGESLLNDQSLRQVARDAFQRKADMALTLYNQALQLPDVAQKKNVVQNWHNTFGKAHSDLIMPGSNEAIQAAISQNLSAQEAANVLHAWIQEQGGDPLKTIELNADLTNYVKNKAANGPGFESYISTAKPFIKTFHELNPAAQTAVLAAIQDTTKQQNLALIDKLGKAAAEDRKNAYNELTSFADGIVREFTSIKSSNDQEFDKAYLEDSAYDALYEFDENGNRTEKIKPILTEEAFLTIAYAQRPGQDELIVKALVHKFPNPTRFKEAYASIGKADVYTSLQGEGVVSTIEQGNVTDKVSGNNTTTGSGSTTTSSGSSTTGSESSTTVNAAPPPPTSGGTDELPREDLRSELYQDEEAAPLPNPRINEIQSLLRDPGLSFQDRKSLENELSKLGGEAYRQRATQNYRFLEGAKTAVKEFAAGSAPEKPQRTSTPEITGKEQYQIRNLPSEELSNQINANTSELKKLIEEGSYTPTPQGSPVVEVDPSTVGRKAYLQNRISFMRRVLQERAEAAAAKEAQPPVTEDTEEKTPLPEGGIGVAKPSERRTKIPLADDPFNINGTEFAGQIVDWADSKRKIPRYMNRDLVDIPTNTPSRYVNRDLVDIPTNTPTPRYVNRDLVDIPTNTPPAINTEPTDPINKDAQRIEVSRPLPTIDGVLEAQEALEEREAARLEFLQNIADNPKYSRYRAEPKKIEELIVEAAEQADLPAEEAALVVALESDFGKTSNNITQIKGAALKDVEKRLGRKLDPKDPEDNILAGVTYFKMLQKTGDSFREAYTRYVFGPTGGEKVLKAKDNELISEVISPAAYDNNSGWLSFNGQSLTVKQVTDKIDQRIKTKGQEVASLGFAVATSVPEPEMGIPTAPSYRGESSGLASVYQTQLDQGPTEAATPTYMNGKPLTSMGVANDKVDIVYSVEGQDTASREDAERLLRIQEEKARTAREEQNAFIREAEKRKYDAERRTTVSQQIRGGQIIKLEEQINWLLAQPWMNQTGLLTERMELEAASTIIDSYRRKKNPTPADERILQFAINSYERVMDVLQSLQGK